MLDELALARHTTPDLLERSHTHDEIRLFLFWHQRRLERRAKIAAQPIVESAIEILKALDIVH